MIQYDPRSIPSDPDERRRLFARLWGAFPNQAPSVASYDFTSQSIELANVSSEQWAAHLKGSISDSLSVLPIFSHELTHWFDHVGTTWGAALLRKQYLALDAFMSGEENRFQDAIPFAREIHSFQAPTYFTFYSDNWLDVPPGERWKAQPTCGVRFDRNGQLDYSQPIPFITFLSQSTGERCRFPFTVLTLLETRAVWAEISAEMGLNERLDEDSAAVARADLIRKVNGMLYDPLLIEYLACVHYTANTFRIQDPLKAFSLSSLVAALVLNMLSEHFNRLKTPALFEAWKERNDMMKAQHNRGYAFIAIIQNASQIGSDGSIDDMLQASGLPASQDFQEQVLSETDQSLPSLVDRTLLTEFANLLGSGGYAMNHWDLSHHFPNGTPDTPLVILGDGNLILHTQNPFQYSEQEYAQRLDRLTKISRSMFEFQQACAMS